MLSKKNFSKIKTNKIENSNVIIKKNYANSILQSKVLVNEIVDLIKYK